LDRRRAAASSALSGLAAKIRYRMADASCRVLLDEHDGAAAIFDAPQWAPTPGNTLVLYDGDVCLGGGVIDLPLNAGAGAANKVAQAV
jgi:tRNA-specific 2-thiouridylase